MSVVAGGEFFREKLADGNAVVFDKDILNRNIGCVGEHFLQNFGFGRLSVDLEDVYLHEAKPGQFAAEGSSGDILAGQAIWPVFAGA